jgi:Sec-independent protein translocase protein TatA
MFDFSLAEFGLVGLVALLVLGPKDMVVFMRSASGMVSDLKKNFEKYAQYLKDAMNEVEGETNIVDVIIDEEGNSQRVYDLSKIMPAIKEEGAEK